MVLLILFQSWDHESTLYHLPPLQTLLHATLAVFHLYPVVKLCLPGMSSTTRLAVYHVSQLLLYGLGMAGSTVARDFLVLGLYISRATTLRSHCTALSYR